MVLVVIALLSFAGNCVVAGAFTYMGKQHAKERQFLINTALSNNTYEFAVRQQATAPQPEKPADTEDYDAFPEGLYN